MSCEQTNCGLEGPTPFAEWWFDSIGFTVVEEDIAATTNICWAQPDVHSGGCRYTVCPVQFRFAASRCRSRVTTYVSTSELTCELETNSMQQRVSRQTIFSPEGI